MTSYSEFAKVYDLIYSWKDYRKEAEKLRALILENKKTKGNELLEVACGTGSYIEHLKPFFKVTGVDLSPEMLRIARRKFPGMRFVQGDMRSFNLHKQYDVILCLFSSIGYLKTYANLEKAIANFARHLKPGGVVIIEPFMSAKDYKVGKPWANFVDRPEMKIVRMHVSKKRGDLASWDMHFLVATHKGVKHFREKHELALYENNKFLEIMNRHGLRAKFLKNGLMPHRGLCLGIKKL